MKLPIILVVILVVIFYLIFPLFVWMIVGKTRAGKTITIISLILFLFVLFVGITSKIQLGKEYVIIEMNYDYNWLQKTINWNLTDVDRVDLVINIFMLIPIGLAFVFLNKKTNFKKVVSLFLIGLLTGLTLETIQFVLPIIRSVQLSDVILNMFSVVLGGMIGFVYDNFARMKKERRK